MSFRVIKIGGSNLDDPSWLGRFARVLVSTPGKLILVHGGAQAITDVQRDRGIPVTISGGVRVTPPEVAEIAVHVLCGAVRTAILDALRGVGLDPVGIAGLDGFLDVELIDEVRLGRVGRVVGVDTAALEALVHRGKVPVLAPVSLGPDGAVVNVNSDQVAAAVAHELPAAELLLVTNVPGVFRNGRLLAEVTPSDVRALAVEGSVSAGMTEKLVAALHAGPARVRIGDIEVLTSSSAGTLVLGADAVAS